MKSNKCGRCPIHILDCFFFNVIFEIGIKKKYALVGRF